MSVIFDYFALNYCRMNEWVIGWLAWCQIFRHMNSARKKTPWRVFFLWAKWREITSFCKVKPLDGFVTVAMTRDVIQTTLVVFKNFSFHYIVEKKANFAKSENYRTVLEKQQNILTGFFPPSEFEEVLTFEKTTSVLYPVCIICSSIRHATHRNLKKLNASQQTTSGLNQKFPIGR